MMVVAKAVDQSLHSQDPQVHNRLLETGEGREAGDLFYACAAQADGRIRAQKLWKTDPACTARSRLPETILGDHGRLLRLRPTPRPRPATNHRSRMILRTAETARNAKRYN